MEMNEDYRELHRRNHTMLSYNKNFNLRATTFNLPATTYETVRPVTFPTTMSPSPRTTTAPTVATANVTFDNHPINQDLWDSVQCPGPQSTTQAPSPNILAASASLDLHHLTTITSDLTSYSYPTTWGTPSKQPSVWIQPAGPAQQALYQELSSGSEGYFAQDNSPQPCLPHQPSPPQAGFPPQPLPRQEYYVPHPASLQESFSSQPASLQASFSSLPTSQHPSQEDVLVPQPATQVPWAISPVESSAATITPPVEPRNTYPCRAKKDCTDSFTHKAARKRHEDRHLKPFHCHEHGCARGRKGFSRIDNLQSHLARVHNIQPEPKRRHSPLSYDESRLARLEEEVVGLREQVRRNSEASASRSPAEQGW